MAATGSLLGVGISGLTAARQVLTTVGHNIANAATEGYTRQRVELVTREPQFLNGSFQGKGVDSGNIRRIYDSFLSGQVRVSSSSVGHISIYEDLAIQVDDLLADPDAGLTPMLQNFFDAVQDLVDDPSSVTARQVLISEAVSLQQRLNTLDSRLGEMDTEVAQSLATEVIEINGIGQAIADLNHDIQLAYGLSAYSADPNDLLDQRDQLLVELAKHVKVTPITQEDGTVNVAIGSGQMLVLSNKLNPISLVNDPYDPTRAEVGFDLGGGSVASITNLLGSGSIAGLVQFREEFLDVARNSLGRLALGLAETFNAQHQLGMDMNNAMGGDFFRDISAVSPQSFSHSANTGNGVIATDVVDSSATTTSDYQLRYDGTNYTLTRLDDGTTTSFLPGALPLTTDGVTISLASGTVNAGDQFLIRPTRLGARDFRVQIRNADEVAVSAPVATSYNLANTGSGAIGPAVAGNTTNLPLSGAGGAITLTFDPDAGGVGVPGFTVTNGPGGTLAYDPATKSIGKTFTFAGFGGLSFEISGVPDAGDRFTLADNVGGIGDNSNALALAELQVSGIFDGGNTSYEDAYGQLVVDVGALTRQARINRGAQETLLDQALKARDAVSGVNLDEEAADLLKFQQAYQASARAIAVADTLFQTLIDVVSG